LIRTELHMSSKSSSNDLRDIGLKVTGPRIKILEFFHQNPGAHYSADDLYIALTKEGLDIGLATVYRVLTQFEQAGILLRNHFESGKAEGKAIFELNEGVHHDHLVCIDCGHVEEFVDAAIETRQREIAQKLGFDLQEHALALYGTCTKKNCQWKKK
jgi:Fur family transcriptional regulator, ferric uptake regulator